MAKAKAMTNKEFWGILEEAGYGKDFWGYEGLLNIISIHDSMQAEKCREDGCNAAAGASQRRADVIFDALVARGYYNK